MVRRILVGAAVGALLLAGVACAPDNPSRQSGTTTTSEPPLHYEPPSTAPSPATVSTTTIPK
jgi:hypothetical protein